MRPRAARAALLVQALSLAACSSKGTSDSAAPPPTVATAPPTSASPPASAASAVTAAPPLDPLPAPSDRPSARAAPPPGIDAARWRRIFEQYGRLLDMDILLEEYHRRYPDRTEVVNLGVSHQGRPVRALLIADRPSEARARPSVLLNGSHHGDEPLSSRLILDAIDTLLTGADTDPKIKRYLAELAVWCVPLVNPDGFSAFLNDFGAGRKNGRETRKEPAQRPLKARGVDLNRNYPFRWGALGEVGSRSLPEHRQYRGPEAGSEPEVRAMMALSDREHFVASISYHIGTVALLAPYTIDGVPEPSPNEAWIVAEDIIRKMPRSPERPHRVIKNLYPVDGTDQDYHRFAHGTLALLFELASRSWETAPLVQQTLDAIRPSWTALFDRYLDGPSVEGHVRDAAGRPASVEVRVAEIKTRAGEVWKSRGSDGFFGRYLPRFGRYTLRAIPAGGAPVDKTIEVSPEQGRARVDLVVECPAGCP